MKDYVAWTMADGNTMAGKVTSEAFGQSTITRVDGGTCRLPTEKLRPATVGDVDAACRFYQNIGK